MHRLLYKILPTTLLFSLFLAKGYSQCEELVWSEEFNYTGFPDQSVWTYEVGDGCANGICGWGNNELEYYTEFDADNAWVENGVLTITAIKENIGGRAYTSARIITRDKFEYRYGRLEASIKMGYSKGIWCAFWTMGADISEVGWPDCGEIDIAEFTGGDGNDNRIIANPIWDYAGNYASNPTNTRLDEGIFADTFHTFALDWTPTALTWYLDGKQFHVMSLPDDSEFSEFHNPYFILLNMAVGGTLPGNPDGTSVFPNSMQVDYVRLYKNPEIEGEKETVENGSNLSFEIPYNANWSYSWKVPADAEIVSGGDSSVIRVNWGCEGGEMACTVVTENCTHELTFPVTVNENIISGPMFIDPEEEGAMFTIKEQSGTTIVWDIPVDAEIVSGQGNDTIIVNWGSIFSDVSVTLENSCGLNTLTFPVLMTGQYAYPDPASPHRIPGVFNATAYDYGGEGIAYHDVTANNEGGGVRQDEAVDTENGDNGGPNVGWIRMGEWLEYSIEVQESAYYDVFLRVASDYSSAGPVSFHVNDQPRLSSVTIPGTGGWGNFTSLNAGRIQLDVNDTLLRVFANGGNFNLGNLTFRKSTYTEVNEFSAGCPASVYPNPATSYLTVECEERLGELRMYTLQGVLLKSIDTGGRNTLTINIEDIEPGIYMISGKNERGFNFTVKFTRIR